MRAPDLGRGALAGRGYDAAAFAAAVERGTAADGRALSRAMPRYALAPGAVAALWDLTGPLEARRRHGVTPGEIRLALLYDPGDATSASLARSYGEALAHHGSSVWGRRVVVEAAPLDQAAGLAGDSGLFAVLGPFAPDPAPKGALAAGQVPMLHGFGTTEAPGALVLPLALDRGEEMAALAEAAAAAGVVAVALAGGDAAARAEATRVLRRAGLEVVEDGRDAARLLLSPDAEAPGGARLLVPEAVLLRRPDLAGRAGVLSVPTLPFLAGAADPVAAYAEVSARVLLTALEEAGADPTRWSLAQAARSARAEVLAGEER